jgi:hypothetical protein
MPLLKSSRYSPSDNVQCELHTISVPANATDWVVVKESTRPFVINKLSVSQVTAATIAKHVSVKVGDTWYNNVLNTVNGATDVNLAVIQMGVINGIRIKNSTGTTANDNLVYLEFRNVR